MAAITRDPKIRFLPLEKLNAIGPEDFCGICFENFLETTEQNKTQSEGCWNKKVILVHTNTKTKRGYSCEIHRDCLQSWLAKNRPKCPFCRSPVKPLDDGIYTLRDKAVMMLQDGVKGALIMGKFTAAFFLVPLISNIICQSENPLQDIYIVTSQIAGSEKVQQLMLFYFTSCAAASIGGHYIRRKRWFFRRMLL